MTPNHPERRVRRSSDPQTALCCLLEATRQRSRLKSLALADRSGLLVAGAGPAKECDELAAWARLVDEKNGPANGPPLQVKRVRARGIEVYLSGSGPTPVNADLLATTAAGCLRILRGRAA